MFYVLSNVFGCVDNKALPTRAILICQFLFARGDEENWLFFIYYLYLLKNWRVSF